MTKTDYRRFFLRWALFLAWSGVVAWLSLIPRPPEINVGFFGWDKVQHAAAYGVFTLLAGFAFDCFPSQKKRCWLIAVAAAAVFGGMLELAQGLLTIARSAELGDLVADVLGALCVYAVVGMIQRRVPMA